MRKKILFVIPALGVGGAEKSLLELLEKWDYEKYEVDLLLLKREGVLKNSVPSSVNIVSLNAYEQLMLRNGFKSIVAMISEKHISIGLKKLFISVLFKILGKYYSDDFLIWKMMGKNLSNFEKKYDVVFSYLQGITAYYTIDKICAKKKVLWMHSAYGKYVKNIKFDRSYNERYDDIITVSESAREDLISYYPNKSENIHVILNSINVEKIKSLANEPILVEDDVVNIVSVGRLHYAKGFDLVIPAISRLKDEGYNIKWMIVGEGPERKRLRKIISKANLEDTIILIGEQKNPYPYIKAADIYIQPSRYEGYCITLAEAIVLERPIIASNFFGAKEQIIDQHTGLITTLSTSDIYGNLKKLVDNDELRNNLSSNIKNSFVSENKNIDKVYQIIQDAY